MNYCAIVCEYNPFHNGHLFHINETKRVLPQYGIACFLSGNFSERGELCVLNKYSRAKIACENGADFVVGMPSFLACQSAEVFCLNAIKCINSFPNVTHISFGSECGDAELLTYIASFLLKHKNEIDKKIKSHLKTGISYSASFEKTMQEIKPEYALILSKPNNMLAVEYIKAIIKTKSKLTIVTIKRNSVQNSNEIQEVCSASAIRNSLSTKNLVDAKNSMPANSFDSLWNNNQNTELLNNIFSYSLQSNSNLKNIFEVSEGIEKYLLKSAPNFKPTARYRLNKINRTLLNIALNIKTKDVKLVYSLKKFPYLKLLACKDDAFKHLECNTILITRIKDIPQKKSRHFETFENYENYFNAIYNLVSADKIKATDLSNKVQIIK